jgi:hypothetical protein
MRPRLPLIRCAHLITRASASDRGWIRELPGFTITLFWFLPLPLLVPRIFAYHHHATVPANHLALVADPFDARLDFHRASF